MCFKALTIVYCIQIYTLSVPVCALRHFFSSTIFKFILYPFHVPWGTFSRLLYSNLYFIRSSVCLEAPILVYCIQILNFTVQLFISLFVKNSLIEYYFQKLSLSVPLWVLRQLLSTIIFKIQNLICNCMRWHLSFLYSNLF